MWCRGLERPGNKTGQHTPGVMTECGRLSVPTQWSAKASWEPMNRGQNEIKGLSYELLG